MNSARGVKESGGVSENIGDITTRFGRSVIRPPLGLKIGIAAPLLIRVLRSPSVLAVART